MPVEKLIEVLGKLPKQAPVRAWDPDWDDYRGVTGVEWTDDGSEVMLVTDDNQ